MSKFISLMNTKIRSFAFCLTACLLASVTGHAYEQDNWYEVWKVPVDRSFGVAVWEDQTTGVSKIYQCNGYTSNGRISVYDMNGSLDRHITVAQSRYWVLDICLDSAGNLYIAEETCVTSLANDGTFRWRSGKNTSISNRGSSGSGNGEYNWVRGITLGPDGNLYIADSNNHRVQVLDVNGTFVRKFGQNGTAPGQFNLPKDLAFLSDGTLVVGDNSYLNFFEADGTFLRRTNNNSAHKYLSVASDSTIFNRQYLRDSSGNSVVKHSSVSADAKTAFTNDGDLIESFGDSGGYLRLWKRAYRTKGLPQRNVIPQPAIRKISQRSGTNVLDLDFEIIDSDDTNATVGIFAYCDNQMILPKTWVDGTGNKIGTSIATNQTHRVSWDVKQDWNASTGNIKFEILCQDGRTNKPVDLHFLTLPFPDGNMTISRSPLVWADFVNYALFLLSTGEAQYDGNSTSEITYNGTQILHQSSNGAWVNGTNTRNTLLAALGSNYRFATTAEVTKAREAATPGTENAWDPIRQVVPRNLPYKVNEYGFDVVTKGSNSSFPYSGKYWVIKE